MPSLLAARHATDRRLLGCCFCQAPCETYCWQAVEAAFNRSQACPTISDRSHSSLQPANGSTAHLCSADDPAALESLGDGTSWFDAPLPADSSSQPPAAAPKHAINITLKSLSLPGPPQAVASEAGHGMQVCCPWESNSACPYRYSFKQRPVVGHVHRDIARCSPAQQHLPAPPGAGPGMLPPAAGAAQKECTLVYLQEVFSVPLARKGQNRDCLIHNHERYFSSLPSCCTSSHCMPGSPLHTLPWLIAGGGG